MMLRRVAEGREKRVEILGSQGWVRIASLASRLPALNSIDQSDAVAILALSADIRDQLVRTARDVAPTAAEAQVVLPFAPCSFRDFMLYETHAVDAARGFVRRYMPATARIAGAYEVVTGRTFPPLKPHALWYRQPIYYFGNHLTFAVDGENISRHIPARSITSSNSASCLHILYAMLPPRRRKAP
ncbi:MAG: hypothetical protein WC829_04845 [Hyphomicrobium sp.]|jgi:hypothetical protein